MGKMMSFDENETDDHHDFKNKRASIGRRKQDHAKILQLISVRAIAANSTVDMLRELLRLAENGEITGIAYVATGLGGMNLGMAGETKKHRHAAKGALMDLANLI